MNVIEGQANGEKQFSLIFCSLTFNNILNIIVMLILVGVSVTVALNGGLFTTAKEAAEGTASKRNEELELSSGKVEINGVWYNSIDEYVNGNGAGSEVTLPTGWEVTEKPATWTSNKVTAIKEIATGNIVALPEGYSISEVAEEQTVDGGLVITDGTNEFVWIPVTGDFINSYSTSNEDLNYSEPTELTDLLFNYKESTGLEYSTKIDSRATIDHYYGEGYFTYPETAEEKENVNNTFAYSAHYSEMMESVNKYDGFYIGRYETTIDGSNIGSKAGATVLRADAILKEGTFTDELGNEDNYYYRWWGLYAAQRSSNVAGNGTAVQTNMVWGQQWDAMIAYFGSKDYSAATLSNSTTTDIENAGESKYNYNDEEISDVICNIYDLRGNSADWTAESCNNCGHVNRGGYASMVFGAELRDTFTQPYEIWHPISYFGSRLTLYLK